MKDVSTVVFVHGLARKPAPEKLEEIWLGALQRGNPRPDVFPPPNDGLDLSLRRTRPYFNYWADVFYGTEYEVDLESYYEATDGGELATEIAAEAGDNLGKPPTTPRERAFVESFEATMLAQLDRSNPAAGNAGPPGAGNLEIAGWLPPGVREAIIKKAAMEAYYFLFDKTYTRADGKTFQVRKELRTRLLEMLNKYREESRKLVIVSHSMGTMVAYDVLRNCRDCPAVDTLITIGSPLGVKEVQDELRAPGSKLDFPATKLGSWINIFDRLDPVCGADPAFSSNYAAVDGKRIRDVEEANWGSWRHTATHYLSGAKFRAELAAAL